MPLDLDNRLPAVHMKFFTSDTNEVTFCMHVDSCEGFNVRNLQLHQWIITTNPYIVESYIELDD